MSLSNNTTSLEEILATVNELPESGSGDTCFEKVDPSIYGNNTDVEAVYIIKHPSGKISGLAVFAVPGDILYINVTLDGTNVGSVGNSTKIYSNSFSMCFCAASVSITPNSSMIIDVRYD